MTHWGTVTALQRLPQLGTEPVDLSVELPAPSDADGRSALTEGIRSLYQKCQFYDVFLVGGGNRFPAHMAALGALSLVFREQLVEMRAKREAESLEESSADQGHLELHLDGVSSTEAIRALLDFVYGLAGGYAVSSDEANVDVLRMAKHYQIQALQELAARRLVQDLSTANIVQRLKTCREFALEGLFEQISDELIGSGEALREVASHQEVEQEPELLQILLVRAARCLRPPTEPAAVEKRGAPATWEAAGARDGKRAKVADFAAVSGGA